MASIPVTLSTDDLIDKDIFELLGLKDADQKRKDKIIADMLETIENRVTERMLDALDMVGEAENFDKLVDADDQVAADALLLKHGIDLSQISLEESMLYKAEIVNLITGASLPQLQPAS